VQERIYSETDSLTRRISSLENTHESSLNIKLDNIKLNIQSLIQNTTDINSKVIVLKGIYDYHSCNENENSIKYLIDLIQKDVNLREIRKNVAISVNSAHTLSGILKNLEHDIQNASVTMDNLDQINSSIDIDERGNIDKTEKNHIRNSPRIFENILIKKNMVKICVDLNKNIVDIFKDLNYCDDYFQNHDIHIEGKWTLLSGIVGTTWSKAETGNDTYVYIYFYMYM
jgi:hypothetical protein